MAVKYQVKSAVVKVSLGTASGNRVAHFARRGDLLPEGVPDAQVKSLLERKLIEKHKGDEESQDDAGSTAVTIPEGEPSEEWKADELKAYAAKHEVDLGSASRKADIVAALAAAKQPKTDGADA